MANNQRGLVYYCLRLTSATLGFPCLTEEHISNNRVGQEELPVCGQFTRRTNRRAQIISVLVYFIYGTKNLLYLNFTLSSIDYIHVNNNLINIKGERTIQFGCLMTNCSTDSVMVDFADEMVKLPLYSICQQPSRWMYEPMMNAHLLGLVVTMTSTYWIVLMGVLMPLYQMYVGFAAPTVMAIICPISALNGTRHQIYRLWIQLTESFLNYLASVKEKEAFSVANGLQRQVKPTTLKTIRQRESLASWAQNRLNKLEHSLQSMESSERFNQSNDCALISDSLPINTNHRWISQMSKSFVRTQLIIMLTFSLTSMIIQTFAYQFSGVDYEFRALAKMLQQNNCSLWRQDENHAKTRRLVNLKQVAIPWDMFNLLQMVLVVSLPLFNLTTAFSIFHQCINDIRILITDLETQLKLAVEFNRLRPCFDIRQQSIESVPGGPFNVNDNKFSMKLMREKLIDGCELVGPTKLTCGFDGQHPRVDKRQLILEVKSGHYLDRRDHLNRKLAYQQYALKLLRDNDCRNSQVDTLIELLEKIQINYWYLMAFIKQYNAPMANVFVLGYLLNYGLALVSVYLFLNIKRSIFLPQVVTMLTVLVANTLIGWASSVHSGARKLEPMFWTLIAQTNATELNDERLKHLRVAWIKQLELIDGEGGLCLKAFNFRVTYVGILQVLIWTSSILLLAYIRQ